MSDTTIGIDVSKAHLDACRWPGDETCRVSNDAAGHRALVAGSAAGVRPRRLRGTGRYHRALERALHRAGLPFARLNPTRVRRFAEATGTLAKTDRVDAACSPAWARCSSRPRRPRRRRSTPSSTSSSSPAPPHPGPHRRREPRPPPPLPLLRRQPAAPPAPPARALAEIDAAIAALVAADPPRPQGRHPLQHSRGRQGHRRRHPRRDARDRHPRARPRQPLRHRPVTRESGQWKGQARIGGGRADLRRALYMPALSAVRCNPDLKAVYDRLRGRGKPAKLALTAVMRKLLILANLLVHENRLWEPR